MIKSKTLKSAAVGAALLAASGAASAAEWSDTSIGYRYGTHFHEPFNPQNITKNIFFLTHVSAKCDDLRRVGFFQPGEQHAGVEAAGICEDDFHLGRG